LPIPLILTFAALACAPADGPFPPPPEGFSSPEAAQSYSDAVAHFERGEFEKARDGFEAARKGVTGDAKARIAEYTKACNGAKDLEKIQKEIAKERWRAAFVRWEKLEASHGKTPLRLFIEPLRATIEGGLYLRLATFEEDPPEPERRVADQRPSTTGRVTDAEFVKEGKASLEWRSGYDPKGDDRADLLRFTVPLAAFDGSLAEQYCILDFWIHASALQPRELYLYFGVEPGGVPDRELVPTKENLRDTRCKYFAIPIEKAGWRHIRIDLRKDLLDRFELDWSEITGVSLGGWQRAGKIHCDALRLERP
jgi:hypothetical protein